MVLIFSKAHEGLTYEVSKWLDFLKVKWIRVNNFIEEHENLPSQLFFDINKKGLEFTTLDGKRIPFSEIDCVWYRRNELLMPLNTQGPTSTLRILNNNRISELKALKEYIFEGLKDKKWLSNPETSNIQKIRQLLTAQKVGLRVPEFIVTAQKKLLEQFFEHNSTSQIITKAIQDISSFQENGLNFSFYTSLFKEELVKSLPDVFFPSFFQIYIEKEFEIRVFYLEGECYAAAIFSQLQDVSKVDFRLGNNINRIVPYVLPKSVENQISKLMKSLGLNTGSLDLIKSKEDGKLYFLEVNPVGQVGFISYNCNYLLDKKIALFLQKQNKNEK